MAQSYKWLLDQGIRPGHVALIGDSAAGALAVTTILRARQQGLPLPAATMPLSPWLDMEATGATFETNAQKDLIVSRDRRRSCRAAKRSPRTRLCKNRVRNRLSAGGRWIRTSGSACDASPA
jgi:acetyl esterase/lipase